VDQFLPQLSEAVRQRLLREKPDDSSFDLLFHDQAKTGVSTVPIQFEASGHCAAPVYGNEAQHWLIGLLAEAGGAGRDSGQESNAAALED
jgi:hypothetical protein